MPALPPPAMTLPSPSGMTTPNIVYIEPIVEDIQRRRSQYDALQLHFGTGGTLRFTNNTLVDSTNNVFAINRQAAQPCRAQLLPLMMQDIKEYLVPQVKDICQGVRSEPTNSLRMAPGQSPTAHREAETAKAHRG